MLATCDINSASVSGCILMIISNSTQLFPNASRPVPGNNGVNCRCNSSNPGVGSIARAVNAFQRNEFALLHFRFVLLR